MTVIELIGCTGAGKSTLANQILRVCVEQGIDACTGYDLVLRRLRLDGVESRFIRGLVVNLLALGVCLVGWRDYAAVLRFVLRRIAQLPLAWSEKLYVGRDICKNLGIYQLARRAADRQIVVLDEGTLHIAHYLFVHLAAEPNMDEVAVFSALAPLPDLAVYVSQLEPVLVARTLERGHKRIHDHSRAGVERFIRRAVATFEQLTAQPSLQDRLLIVAGQPARIVHRQVSYPAALEPACEIVAASVAATDSALATRLVSRAWS